jgi:primosomal protein N' (replication factor Y)
MLESPLPQLDRLFDYAVPEALHGEAAEGVRVKVPLRSAGRVARGYIVELTRQADYSGTLSEIDEIVSPVPVLTPEVWSLARRVADRGAGNASDVVRLAVPPRQVRVEKAWQREQESKTGPQPYRANPHVTGYGDGVVDSANDEGRRLAVAAIPAVFELSPGVWVARWAVTLAEAAARALAAGRSAIVAVPDYRDQEQLIQALAALVPIEAIATLDARQPNAERYRSFLRCLEHEPRIIVGNRSVVYAPAHRLGLIAVWDEADPLHQEPLSPYASTRDVSLVRQEQTRCALLFLSHSRSTWLERLVELRFVQPVTPDPAVLPHVIPTVDQAGIDNAAHARIPSSAWSAVRRALDQGPVLVQVARPGYAPVLACQSCRTPARCRVCDGALRVGGARQTPSCELCGAIAADWHCRHCDATGLRLVAAGSARTAEELGRAFPGVRVIVSDGERNVLTVDHRPALVVATRGAEPLAAGGYRAVLLLDGDRMLARESLTVAEDCLRWWSNAIALAAPRAPAIITGVGGDLARALVTWRQDQFAAAELPDRKALRFPPMVRLATVTGRPETVDTALDALPDSVPGHESATIDVLGPVDAGDGLVRATVRFDYALGLEVARSLRSSIIRNATGRTKRQTSKASGTKTSFRPPPPLRVRFDDTEILE